MAEKVKGHRRPGSGNQPMFPGDVVHGKYLIECKTTDKDSFTVSRKLLEKIMGEASSVNKEWMVVIDTSQGSFAVMDFAMAVELIGEV